MLFILNRDLLAVDEAREKYHEAMDGAAWLLVLEESWQDEEAASNLNLVKKQQWHSKTKSSLESNKETKTKRISRIMD